MSTNFPGALDALTNPLGSDSLAAVSHAAQHTNANDAIEALEARVGITGSADTSSITYRLSADGEGAALAALTTKATPVDADLVALSDSEAGGVLKKFSWSSIKTALQSVFATLAGIAGGQTIIGGTGATDKLTLQGTSGTGTATEDAINIKVGNAGATTAIRLRNDERLSIGSVVAPGTSDMLIDWETYKGNGNTVGKTGWDAGIRTGGVQGIAPIEKRVAIHNMWTWQPSANNANSQVAYLNEMLVPDTNSYNLTAGDCFNTLDLTDIRGSGTVVQFHNHTSEVAYHSSGGASYLEGIEGRVHHYGSGTVAAANSLYGQVECRSAGTITTGWGTEGVVRARAGTITNAIGVGAKIGSYTGGTINNVYGVNIGGPQEGWTSSGTITNCYALYIGSSTNIGTNKWSIYNQSPAVSYFAGSLALGITAASAKVHAISTTEQLRLGYDASNYLSSTTDSTGKTTFTAVGTAPNLKWLMSDATTNAIYDLVTFSKNSSGAGAAGLGVRVNLAAKSSTTADTLVGAIDASWVDATHASRKGSVKINAYDTAIRECIRAEASGTAAMLGFFGVTAVVRPTALTAQLTTLTYTAPTVADYAIQDLTSTGGFGFVTKDEGNSVLAVIKNLQDRVAQLETKLQSLGLLT